MNRSQRITIGILSLIALTLAAALGVYAFGTLRNMAQTPLGPSLPFIPKSLPPTWTASPGPAPTQMGQVALVPTVSFPTSTPGPRCGAPPLMNVLVIGTDTRGDNYTYGLGDAIRLVRVDFTTPKVSALEFPRDLWVEIPHIEDNLNGQDHEKLNQAFLYGQPGFKYWDDPSEGSGLMALTLNRNFGANIDHYITVNMRTFEHVIDALGGIEVVIPNEEVAKTANLSVGTHLLNGPQALKLARNRSGGSFERGDNQNLVLCAVRKKLTSPQIVAQIPALIETFRDNIRTDFTPEQLGQLACLAPQMPPENILLASFPGDLFKQTRVFDPVFDKRIAILEADFTILSDFVVRFQAGTWPVPAAENTSSSIDTEDAPSICQ
ncbi:MAG: LCP family protein [Anaerolineales bacterium]|uniref:LCP family protein n=1 Tax=Candidatus Villigracilis vicinus TaxID=3140679 RepID=UPI00313537D3|nr:LCP family protein [Anaerolineales bacterium]MBK9781174.1 LCP family protein [Anaerolineales bacterium]